MLNERADVCWLLVNAGLPTSPQALLLVIVGMLVGVLSFSIIIATWALNP